MARILPEKEPEITLPDGTVYVITDEALINKENPLERLDFYDAWGPTDPIERACDEMEEALPV